MNIVELWVRVWNGVRVRIRVRVRVRVRVWVRFRVRVRTFSKNKTEVFSRGKMTSYHSGGWKQVKTV